MTTAGPEVTANRWIEQLLPVAYRMGVRIVELRPGHAVSEVPLEGNGNHFGVMYAGVLFTVAEVLGGVIGIGSYDAERFVGLVKDFQIRFRRPATGTVRATASVPPETLAATARAAERDGKAGYVLEAEITDASGELIATTHGDYQLRALDGLP